MKRLLLVFLPLLFISATPAEAPKVPSKEEAPMPKIPKRERAPVVEEITPPKPVDVKQHTEDYESAFVRTIIILVALILLIILTVWMFRRMSRGRVRTMNFSKTIKILEKRPLSQKSMLYLIEVGGKRTLIAESHLEVRTLSQYDYLESEKDL